MRKLARGFTPHHFCRKLISFRFGLKSGAGFTLIELLVVISIIGILAVLVIANLNSARSRARDTARKSDLRNISTALRLYYNDYKTYPDNGTSPLYQIMGCGAAGITACTWGATWSVGTTIYMQTLPADPIPSQNYQYVRTNSGDGFTLSACLENSSDAQGVAASPNPFAFTCTTMFQVIQ